MDDRGVKERPILFSPEMVRANLRKVDPKRQTRRVVKPQPRNLIHSHPIMQGHWSYLEQVGFALDDHVEHVVRCPYGVPGDRLWCRETWADVNSSEGPAIAYRADSDVIPWRDFSETFGPDHGGGPSMDYDAYPGEYTMWWSDLLNGAPEHRWRPSIFMPRWASRITLEVTDIRVERVQDIADPGLVAEGIPRCGSGVDRSGLTRSPRMTEAFRTLWDSINAKPKPKKTDGGVSHYVSYPWGGESGVGEHRGLPHHVHANPHVWVVGYKQLPPDPGAES